MLKLNNVSKTYISKGKQKVEALKDINLEINDRGLVFILGKSGSGKSTLLNILGGIDGATSGEILVDNQSFANFKQADYDNYRNQYVGFVFQEFNLLNDFDVSGNVALALRLSRDSDISEKVSKALQSVGLSDEYLTRKIYELSGGEKQRVAIARAIVKESKLILADEPTGNLDSATGESIWNILKDLSAKKLVIVVTHDRESAEKYGDRIIEISDGKILSDSGKQPESQGEVQQFSPERKSLSNAVCFRMGANNLAQRKIKSASVILLAIFTIFVILLTQLLLSFSPEKSIARFVKDNDIKYIKVTQGTLRHGKRINPDVHMFEATAKYIENNAAYIKNGCVECKQDILDMGFTFIGDALELDDNSIYLTTDGLEHYYYSYYSDSCVEIDGKEVPLSKEEHPPEFLVGKKIGRAIGSTNREYYTVAGIIDLTKYDPLKDGRVIPYAFVKESFVSKKSLASAATYYNRFEIPDITLKFGEAEYSDEFAVKGDIGNVIFVSGKVLTEQGLKNCEEVALADDEIVLSFELYAQFFGARSKWDYVRTDLKEVLSVPPHLGERFPFKINDCESGELILDLGELKLAGIGFTAGREDPCFTSSVKTVNKINAALSGQEYLISVASIDNLQKFLVNFRKQHTGYVSYVYEEKDYRGIYESYSDYMYDVEASTQLFKIIFVSTSTLLSLILLLLAMNLISFSILNRKKEIGILSALGATNRDILKIFLLETLLIAAVTFVFNTVAIIVTSIILNNVLSGTFALSMPLLIVDIFTFITLIAASFGLLLLAALIPLRKIIKLKPIDAIKNL